MRKSNGIFNVASLGSVLIYVACYMSTLMTFGQTQLGPAIFGDAVNDFSGASTSINAAGDIVAIGAPFNDANGNSSGQTRIFRNSAGVWTQLGVDLEGPSANARFGSSVSINAAGTIVAVGAPEMSSLLGGVQVYEYIGSTWTQVGTTILGATANDELGRYVALNSAGTILASSASGGDYVAVYENIAGTWTQIGATINIAINTALDHHLSINATGDILAIGETSGNGLVQIYQNIAGTWTQIGTDIIGEASGDQFGHSVSLNAAGDIVVIGAIGNDDAGDNAGHVRVYKNIAGIWTQVGADIDGETANDRLGYSVSINGAGDVVSVGSPFNDDNVNASGQIRIYQNLSGVWTQVGSDINGMATNDQLGVSISLNATGNRVVAGAPSNDTNGSNSGNARVFQYTLTAASPVSISGEAVEDKSGSSVSMNATGDIVAVGAVNNDDAGDNAGHVRVYQNNAGIWMQVGADIDGGGRHETFGNSVSINAAGSIVAIGGEHHDPTYPSEGENRVFGIVRVYENAGGIWTQVGSDIVGNSNDQFGSAVSLNSAGTIVAMAAAGSDYVAVYENIAGIWTQIGATINAAIDDSGSAISLNAAGDILAIGENSGNGLVQIYQNIAGTWTQIGADIIGEAAGDRFGYSVSLNAAGDIIVIGGRLNDGNGSDSGHARVYQNLSGTWTQIGADIDGEAAGDRFGESVSINDTGDVVSIGSPRNADNGNDSGQIRIYQNLSGVWTQLGADINGTAADDRFGSSMSLNATGNIVAVGAPDNDTNGADSGQVEVFEFESENKLSINAFLSGPYNTSSNLMNDGLRVAGVIPSNSPYGDGAYVIDSEIFNVSGGNAIVDWVLIELRDKNNINTVLETKGALLQRDGDVVDVDGYSSLSFTFQKDNYFVSISHRNHINVVTDTANDLSAINATVNFKVASNLRGTTNAVTELTTGVYGLLAGEVSGDGQIQTTDYSSLSTLIGQAGYRLEDVNMDSQIQTTDITKLLAAFGSGIQF